MVLNLKMSQVTDIAEKEIQEPMANKVRTTDPELCLCVFVECCSHLTNIQNVSLLWQSEFTEQLECREWILNAPCGDTWKSLCFMSHCL